MRAYIRRKVLFCMLYLADRADNLGDFGHKVAAGIDRLTERMYKWL
jgi:hypothetical protein